MPGKRPKQFHRTVSLSQLGESDGGRHSSLMETETNMVMQIPTAASAPERSRRHGGLESIHENVEENCCFGELDANHNPNSALMVELATATSALESSHGDAGFESMLKNMEKSYCCGEMESSVLVDGSTNSVPMPIHNSIGETQVSSHSVGSMAVKPLQQASYLQNDPLSLQSQRNSTLLRSAHGVVLPPLPHFLDACYRCSKRLGHGKDVFIYRGDRAFCSVECRHFQIVVDERREKCSFSSRKEGLEGANNSRGSPSTEGQVGTATAA